MRLAIRPAGIVLIGFVALTLGMGGCGGEPNDEGISDMESQVAPNAPKTQEEYARQQATGGK